MQTSKISRLFLMGSVVLGCFGCQSGKPSPGSAPNDPWEPLFNGRTLAGWRVQVDGLKLGQDPSHVFSVREGVIHTYVDTQATETVPFGFLVSEKEYGILRFRSSTNGEAKDLLLVPT